MSITFPRGAGYVCKACRLHTQFRALKQVKPAFSDLHTRKVGQSPYIQTRAASSRLPPSGRRPIPQNTPSRLQREKESNVDDIRPSPPTERADAVESIDTSSVTNELQLIRIQLNAIAASDEVPEQARVLEILDQSAQFANVIVFGNTASTEEVAQGTHNDNQNISLLSDLEEPATSQQSSDSELESGTSSGQGSSTTTSLSSTYRENAAAELCSIVYTLLKEPKVTIDEAILSTYVKTICQLGHPEFLPEIFFLYANKPMPRPDSMPVQYADPSPSAAKNAIPQRLSDLALDTAILQRDLPLAIAIIDTTVGTQAFRRNKFLRKGSIPLAAAGSTPLVAWAGAEWVAQWQDTFDPAMSKYMTMMGAMAYIGTLGTVGFIALTTWNDHHDRVVWTPGTPLRHRWTREEERLYFDRIAVAWGFQKRQRRGEEMGEEWEALREVLGERSMILDKTDMLEGMQ